MTPAELDALLALLDKCSADYGDRYHTASSAATIRELRGENGALLAALKSSPCPCPIDDDVTVEDCISHGRCGCDNREAINEARA